MRLWFGFFVVCTRSLLNALPFGDVNVLVLTDDHSWVAGHRHVPRFNADYGDVLSFYEQLRSQAADHDLFFVMNGDFMDGTGISSIPPVYQIPILEKMPWDAVNIGNHELYQNATIQYMVDSGFIDHWKGNYLTSNVYFDSSNDTIGSKYTILKGEHQNSRILTFGFLYNFTMNCKMTRVQPVQETVRENWFLTTLAHEEFDAILVLAHMDYQDPLISVIHEAMREIVGTEMPIQFITGHSHIRAFRMVDNTSSSFEAGHFLDTVGFASFPLIQTVKRTVNSSALFRHVYIDANKEALKAILGEGELGTENGVALSQMISDTREKLGLDHLLACSKNNYSRFGVPDNPDSLWRLFLEEVVPFNLGFSNESTIFIQSTGALRYDLYSGGVTLDDVIAVSPFNDTIYKIGDRVLGRHIQQALNRLNSFSSIFPQFFCSEMQLEGNKSYALFGIDYDTPRVSLALTNISGETYDPCPVYRNDGSYLTTTAMWSDFFQSEWKCTETDGQIVESRWILPMLVVLFAALSMYIVQRVKRRRQATRVNESEKLLPDPLDTYGAV